MKRENENGSNLDEDMEEVEVTTVYHKLTTLCTNIEQSIRAFCGDSLPVQQEILAIRNEAFKANAPEGEYALRLFQKYSHEVQTAHLKSASQDGDDLDMMSEIPVFLYEGSGEQLEGMESMKKNIFWFRVGTSLFALLSFAIMSSVPSISHQKVSAKDLFSRDCDYYRSADLKHGQFDFESYQYLLAICVLLFLHSTLFVCYYLLPVDDQKHKYIPGSVLDNYGYEVIVTSGLQVFLRDVGVDSQVYRNNWQSIASFFREYSKTIELIVDGCLLMMVGMASILAASSLETAKAFSDGSDDSLEVHFSLVTFTATFESTNPVCINGNPVGKIRASLAMSFIATLFLLLTFQVSARSFYREKYQRDHSKVHRHRVPNRGPEDEESATV